MQTVDRVPSPTLWRLLLVWSKIGLQSFGGGASTVYLIQREFVDKTQWITIEEYNHFWSLCVMTPGINLVATTVLIGRRLGGTPGIAVSLAGMLLPSATVTCLLTAGFLGIQHDPTVQAIVQGIIPATAGIMLLVGLRFALPLFKAAYKEGLFRFGASLIITLACAIAIIFMRLPVIPVLLFSALLSMLLFTSWRGSRTALEELPANEEEEIRR